MASWFEGGEGKDNKDEISVQPGESTISKEELVSWNMHFKMYAQYTCIVHT